MMALIAIFLSSFLLLLLTLFPLGTDAQVCSNSGFIINGGCSCASGYGYQTTSLDCAEVGLSGTCPGDTISTLNTIDPPAFAPTGNTFSNNNIQLVIQSNFVNNRENFTVDFYGQSNVGMCGFPGTNWLQHADGVGCADQFTFNLDWPNINNNCGFAPNRIENSDRTLLTYWNNINVKYDEPLGASGLVRHVQNSLQMEVTFQEQVTVTSTAMAVNGTKIAQNGYTPYLIEQSYNASTGTGKLVYETITNWPYEVSHAEIACPSATVTCSALELTSSNCPLGTVGATNNKPCIQIWTVIVTPKTDVCVISGSYVLTSDVNCTSVIAGGSSLLNCPGMEGAITATSSITSSNFCPTLTLAATLQATLSAVIAPGIGEMGSVFTSEYVNGNTAYFQAYVWSPQASIENAWFLDVSIVDDAWPGYLCVHDVNLNVCVDTAWGSALNFNTLSSSSYPSGGYPSFAFDVLLAAGGQPAGPGSGKFMAIGANSQATFKVRAVLMVQYQGNKRRLVQHTWTVERRAGTSQRSLSTSATAGITTSVSNGNGDNSSGGGGNNNNNNNGTSGTSGAVVFVGVAVAGIVAGAILVFVVLRRRKQADEAKDGNNKPILKV